ncbi:hydrogenase expression protein HypA [Streptomyces californicus]|uniref:hydrogenase expression protein HypA n=1 Tax=Streptomyces californicus TaxID=67351 RepID=UPI0037A37F1F
MARKQDPGSHIAPGAAGAAGASTGSQVSVRRAVPMSGAAGDPGEALAPGGRPCRREEPSGPGGSETAERGPVNTAGEKEGPGDGAPTRPEARTPAPETAGADPVRGVGAPATAVSSASSPPAVSSAEGAAEGAAATAARPSSVSASEPAAASSSGSGGADGDTAVAAGAGGGPGGRTDEEPPGSRPKKPMLAAAAIAGAVLISVPFLLAGQDDDRRADKEQAQNAAGTVLDAARPVAPETYTSETARPSPTPSRKEKKEERRKEKESVKPSAPQPLKPVVVAPSPSPSRQQQQKASSTKAPPGTAAAALEHLATSDPQGRHICYRAFVAGQGWQVPVCDGTMTGTTGQGKKITALNISVWNVEGSSANALLHDPGAKSGTAKWAPSWTPVIANGKNVYIGSSKAGAPFMTGFAMNVGEGNVCHSAKMRNGGWGPQYCKSSRPDYMFVGTTDNGNWFEAVKLTV